MLGGYGTKWIKHSYGRWLRLASAEDCIKPERKEDYCFYAALHLVQICSYIHVHIGKFIRLLMYSYCLSSM